MSHYGKCKHGIYLGGCRECFPLPKLTKVGEKLIQELVECFNEDKEMTANELADELTKMFKELDINVNNQLIRIILAIFDRNGDQQISMDEFKELLDKYVTKKPIAVADIKSKVIGEEDAK